LKTKLSLALLAAVTCGLSPSAAQTNHVSILINKGSADFRLGKELVATYHFGPEVAKPYFWPLNAPGDVPVTRAWPMKKGQPGETTDHVHQKSAWFCHGDVIPEGVTLTQKIKGVEGVDFWSEAKGHGRIVCTQVGQPTTAGASSVLPTRNEWRTADGVKILDETRNIQLHTLGDARLLTFDITLTASVCPITFGDTKEGSFGVRVDDRLREKGGNGKLTNADGKTNELFLWGQRSLWCDYSGTLDGKAVGLTIFDHPKNPHAACWHSRGYGLMAANPFGRAKSGFGAMKSNTNLVKLAKGESLKLRYGLLLHPGDVKSGQVAEAFERFVKLPPTSMP
jgi:hypothetical protein